VDAEENPVPALLEYLPYRKNDGTADRDAIRHPYLAGHGYANVRVDMRGSGDADGILYDEYLPRSRTTPWKSWPGSPPSPGVTLNRHVWHLLGRLQQLTNRRPSPT